MSPRPRPSCAPVLSMLTLVAVALAGCGDDPTTPSGELSIVKFDGDRQNGVAGEPLARPLVVLVERGAVVEPGIEVSWRVTRGTGSVIAATSRSNDEGLAAIGVMLGPLAGPLRVTAAVAGAAPVTFTAAAVPLPELRKLQNRGHTTAP